MGFHYLLEGEKRVGSEISKIRAITKNVPGVDPTTQTPGAI
jgi:hypothetical protein